MEPKKKEEEAKVEDAPPAQPFSRLFSYATKYDIALIALGSVAALCSGILLFKFYFFTSFCYLYFIFSLLL